MTADVRVSASHPAAKYAGTIAAIVAVWAAVLFTSIFSPDLVTGSQQEHLPIAALTTWFWGAIATGFASVPVAVRRRQPTHDAWWYGLAIAVATIWVAVALVAIFTPRWETGTDPTRVPVGAILAPVIGAVATGFVAGFITLLSDSD